MADKMKGKKADWPLQLCIVGGEIKRGKVKFYGTKKQLKEHLAILNSVGSNGWWDIDRHQLPDEVL